MRRRKLVNRTREQRKKKKILNNWTEAVTHKSENRFRNLCVDCNANNLWRDLNLSPVSFQAVSRSANPTYLRALLILHKSSHLLPFFFQLFFFIFRDRTLVLVSLACVARKTKFERAKRKEKISGNTVMVLRVRYFKLFACIYFSLWRSQKSSTNANYVGLNKTKNLFGRLAHHAWIYLNPNWIFPFSFVLFVFRCRCCCVLCVCLNFRGVYDFCNKMKEIISKCSRNLSVAHGKNHEFALWLDANIDSYGSTRMRWRIGRATGNACVRT